MKYSSITKNIIKIFKKSLVLTKITGINSYVVKPIILLWVSLLVNNLTFGQTNKPRLALLLAVKGESYVTNKAGKVKLKVPYFFQDKDVIEVKTGNIKILQANGEEITIEAGNSHKIESNKNAESFKIDEFYTNLSEERYFTQSQSNSALSVRGQKMDMILFPISSKLSDKQNAFITCNLKTTEKVMIEIEVFNMLNDSLVYSKNNITNSEIALSEIPLQRGQEYIWMVKTDGKDTDQLGLITYLDQQKQEKLLQFTLNQKLDYLKAYQYYATNELWFAAKRTIKLGTEAYPETDLFAYLLKMMVQ